MMQFNKVIIGHAGDIVHHQLIGLGGLIGNGALVVDGVDIVNVMSKDNGIFVAPPGFGKTVMAAALISEYKKNTLILVNNVNLISQWQDRLNEFLQVNYEFKKDKSERKIFE